TGRSCADSDSRGRTLRRPLSGTGRSACAACARLGSPEAGCCRSGRPRSRDCRGRSFRGLAQREVGDGREFMPILAVGALGPRVDLGELLGEDEAVVEGAAALAVLHDLLADRLQPDALGPLVDALEVAALLAIELGERGDRL